MCSLYYKYSVTHRPNPHRVNPHSTMRFFDFSTTFVLAGLSGLVAGAAVPESKGELVRDQRNARWCAQIPVLISPLLFEPSRMLASSCIATRPSAFGLASLCPCLSHDLARGKHRQRPTLRAGSVPLQPRTVYGLLRSPLAPRWEFVLQHELCRCWSGQLGP